MPRSVFAGLVIFAVVQTAALAQAPQAPAAPPQTPAPQGDAAAGRRLFSGQGSGAMLCMLCHGGNGQGGFGPGLSGRNMSFDDFKRALKQPWGIMPAFPLLNDQRIADMLAFVNSQPTGTPGNWRIPLPPEGGPIVQRQFIAFSCGQCHGEELIHPRRDLGKRGNGVTFEEFRDIVYKTAPAQMGIHSPERVTEGFLRDVFKFMKDEGLRVPISASIELGGAPNEYKLTVWNDAFAGRGLTANDVTISVPVPQGLTVSGGTGAGYQGVSRDAARNADVMTWKAAQFGPQQRQVYTFTLSAAPPAQGAFRGATVAWADPGTTRVPGLTVRDNRVPERGDQIVAPGLEFIVNLAAARPPAQ
jgi:mono/diheme cytochrome c family protein